MRRCRLVLFALLLAAAAAELTARQQPPPRPAGPASPPAPRQPAARPLDRARVLDTMKRATAFMVEKVSVSGGYVWTYLPDMSRRWGEIEARPTMIWMQPPGTPSMGHLFLDAYHATGDEYYYRAAEQVAGALILAQHPSGGWNYVFDFAGRRRRSASGTARSGRNAWRLEEFQHDWGNATFDDGGTAQSATFLLRLYLEKHDPRYKAALDRAIRFVLDSQYPIGAWPQRFPLKSEFSHHGRPDYTSFLTFNDDVDVGERRSARDVLPGPGRRAAARPDLARHERVRRHAAAGAAGRLGAAVHARPEARRRAHATSRPRSPRTRPRANIEHLMRFYRLTGDAKFLARIPEALDWLEAVKLPPDVAAIAGRGGRIRRSSRSERTSRSTSTAAARTSSTASTTSTATRTTRSVTTARSARSTWRGCAMSTWQRERCRRPRRRRTLRCGRGPGLRRCRATSPSGSGWSSAPTPACGPAERATRAVADLDAQGRWISPLGSTSHPYRGDGSKVVAPGDFSRTQVGDETDTSPYRADPGTLGISTSTYIRNMGALIRFLGEER